MNEKQSLPWLTVELTEKDINDLMKVAYKIIQAKHKEPLHKIDGEKEAKRWLTGLMGERAVEIATGLKVVDETVGSSSKYDVPDLRKSGYEVGVKTIDLKNYFHLIPYKNTCPQIMCLRNGSTVYICGIATVEVLNKYQDNSLVVDNEPLKRRKTCFIGHNHLLPLTELENYKITMC